MARSPKLVRSSVSLRPQVARRVREIAASKRTSANRVLVDLIEKGMEAREREKERFFELAERLIESRDRSEHKRLKEELGRMVFGS